MAWNPIFMAVSESEQAMVAAYDRNAASNLVRKG